MKIIIFLFIVTFIGFLLFTVTPAFSKDLTKDLLAKNKVCESINIIRDSCSSQEGCIEYTSPNGCNRPIHFTDPDFLSIDQENNCFSPRIGCDAFYQQCILEKIIAYAKKKCTTTNGKWEDNGLYCRCNSTDKIPRCKYTGPRMTTPTKFPKLNFPIRNFDLEIGCYDPNNK